MMDYYYTKHQVPRSSIPDSEDHKVFYLFKNVSRLLTYLASERNKKLVIRIPTHCNVLGSLRQFAKEHGQHVKLEKV